MAPKKNWYHAAGAVWPVLASAAARRSTITYEQVAPVIPTNPLSVGRALGPIQDYCLANRLPPLTSIVVRKTTGVPGDGFIAWDVDDLMSAHATVFGFNWTLVQNPYGTFGADDTPESLATRLVTNPGDSGELYAKVKVRGVAQDIFRAALRNAYGSKCAICCLSFPNALDAAHIIPWGKATPDQRLDPRNGLLLCSLHHRLFDAGLITLTESGRVAYYDPEMKDGSYSAADKQMTVSLHGKNAHLPTNRELRPSSHFLACHHEQHGFGRLP